ncbi:MAG: serine/threonine-protein kinase [Polyangiaceae bacterium]
MPVAHVDGNDPLIGTIVGGRYRITGLLGEGGMGRVYVGEQQMGTAVRKVAVKTLLPEFSKDPQVVARFMRECGTVVELEHPNTIKFYDFGQTDSGELYIAMEYVDGEPLSDPIERQGAMDFERVDRIMKQVCGSLHEAHEKGIVHRDLKPENIILCKRAGEDDFVKVLDFGIAKRQDAVEAAREQKLTQAGMVLGTPPYMSPEQFTGKELDRRSDIYALGVLTYEMLTGQLPFKANTPWEWATQHMTQQPSPFESTGAMAAQIPPHIKAACMRALSKNPAERQDTAKAFYQELKGDAGARLTAPGLAASGSIASGPSTSTEAFPAASGAPSTGSSVGGPGKTQIGEPFVPPPGAMGPPPGAGPPVGGPPPGMGAAPHQNVPTAGGQALPAPPPGPSGGGGGNRGMLIAVAGGVGLLLVVGIVVAFSGGGDETDEIPPLLDSSAPATTATPDTPDTPDTSDKPDEPDTAGSGGSGTTAAGSGGEGSAPPPEPQPPTTPQPPQPVDAATKACNEVIAAASAKNCAAAKSAMGRCSGPKQGAASSALSQHCSGGGGVGIFGKKTQPPPPPPPPPGKRKGIFGR